jgi:hypothetical protein
VTNELPGNVTEEQRRAIQAFVHSAITPLIEEVIVKKLGQAAIILRDELSDKNARAAVEQAKPAAAVPCDSAFDSMTVNCQQQGCRDFYRPPTASAGVTEAKLAKLVEAAQGFELVEHADETWLVFRSSVEKGLGAGSVRLDGPMAKDARARFALLRAALSAAREC